MLRRPGLLLALLAACADSSDKATDPPGEELACPDERTAHGALALDGVDDHATTGLKPALGLSTFTLEAWLRRDGDGSTATTGVGGLLIVPIMAKGLGEGDGSNVDCNYAFGLWGDVLGADFEDMATGANHPVTGTTSIGTGVWHHVAATYDGAIWRLYVDGVLDAQVAANAAPRADSIHPFGLGTAIDSGNRPHGFLHGSLDEVRVWNRARTQDELADGMFRTIAMGDGLVARWALDTGGGLVATDTAGQSPATLHGGATSVDDDVVLDRGAAPLVAATTPPDSTKTAAEVVLDLRLELATRAPVDVTYHVRPLLPADDFTIVVMPDTQIYTIEGRNLERYFHDQTKWIRDHRVDYNIVGVLHNGDVINNEPQIYQWQVADAAMKRLETPEPGLPEGVPYGVVVGNHDNTLTGNDTTIDTTKFNQYFGVARYEKRSYYGGHYGTKNDHSWVTFSAGGLDFVVVNVMYELDPDPAAIAWARSIFRMHPGAFGILNTHYLLTAGGNFGPQARQIYSALRDLPNVQLMTGGHVAAESRRSDVFEGHRIQSMLADYQGRVDGGQGYMRLWEFSPAAGTVSVRTYSPTLDKYEVDADSEFTLEVDLRGAGGAFADHEVTDKAPDDVSTTVQLEVGKTYEWYAEVSSCGRRTVTPLYRFTTSPEGAREQPPRRQRAQRVTSGPVSVYADDPSLAD